MKKNDQLYLYKQGKHNEEAIFNFLVNISIYVIEFNGNTKIVIA